MFKRVAMIGTFAMLLAAFAAPASAQVRIGIQLGRPVHRVPVAPVVVAPAPYPGYMWQPAHYAWTPYGYQFVPAMWVPAPYAVPPQYIVESRPQPRGLALGVRFKQDKHYERRDRDDRRR